MGAKQITSTPFNTFMPLSFAKTRHGLLLMVNGLDRGGVWDGVTNTTFEIGIDPPGTAPNATLINGGALSDGKYDLYYRFVDLYGNPSDLSPAQTITATANKAFSWTFGVSSQSRVTKRELWRTLADDSRVVYRVAVIDDNTTTTYVEGLSDETLRANAQNDPNTIMPLFVEPFGRPHANRFGVPPNHKAVVALFQDRSFWAVDVAYNVGTVTVTNGSTSVTGTGTNWPPTFKDRYLYLIGAPNNQQAYVIDSAPSATSLVLKKPYSGTSGSYSYVIRPAPSERNKLYFSSADYPEGVPIQNTYTLQENTGDDNEITGLMPHGSYLYILKERHIYRLSFVRQPEIDIAVHLHAFRGAFNQRCWDRVEGTAYLFDQHGPYRLTENGGIDPIGSPIQDFWRNESPDFSMSKWFFVRANPAHETVRFYYSVLGNTRPTRALCFQYRTNHWWTEVYSWAFGAAVLHAGSGAVRQYNGSTSNRWLRFGGTKLDGIGDIVGTVRGKVTSATSNTLTDSSAYFAPDVINVPITIVSGTGSGQTRLVSARISNTSLQISGTWSPIPDTTSTYQLGAIACKYKSPIFAWLPIEVHQDRQFRLIYVPVSQDVILELRKYANHSVTPETFNVQFIDEGSGISVAAGSQAIALNLHRNRNVLGQASGILRVSLPGLSEDRTEGERWVQFELSGYSSADGIRIRGIELLGVPGDERR
jgi:hypothetical protein